MLTVNTKQLLIEAISRAEAGSENTARRLVREVTKYIEAGKPLPEPLKGYALNALKAGARSGGSLDRAFHLTHGPGRSKAPLRSKQMAIAIEVYRLRKAGMKAGDAYSRVADARHKDADQIKKIYLEHRKHVEEFERAGLLAGWIAESEYL